MSGILNAKIEARLRAVGFNDGAIALIKVSPSAVSSWNSFAISIKTNELDEDSLSKYIQAGDRGKGTFAAELGPLDPGYVKNGSKFRVRSQIYSPQAAILLDWAHVSSTAY